MERTWNTSPHMTIAMAQEQGRQYAQYDHDVAHAPYHLLAHMSYDDRMVLAFERAYWSMLNVDDQYSSFRTLAFVNEAQDIWERRFPTSEVSKQNQNWMARLASGAGNEGNDYPDVPMGTSYYD